MHNNCLISDIEGLEFRNPIHAIGLPLESFIGIGASTTVV